MAAKSHEEPISDDARTTAHFPKGVVGVTGGVSPILISWTGNLDGSSVVRVQLVIAAID
jgi:hypothetical protein